MKKLKERLPRKAKKRVKKIRIKLDEIIKRLENKYNNERVNDTRV